MGMSASQARLLSITARINDIEFKSQNIANTKIRLADESEQLAQDYTKALNKQKLTFTTYNQAGHVGEAYKVDLKPSNLQNYGFELVNTKTGEIFRDSDVTSAQMNSMIESGEFIMQKYQPQTEILSFEDGVKYYTYDDSTHTYSLVTGSFDANETYYTLNNITVSGDYNLNAQTDSSEFAIAEAEYNAANMKINNKEKVLDNEMKKLDTEHNALSTEFDAIKNLIGNNIEKSFSLFS